MTAVHPVKSAGGDAKGRRFRLLPTDRSPDELEKEMLDLWKQEKLFQQTLIQSEGKPEFVFFEGPPTANGRPGIHHVFSRTVKDLFCRYRAMRGRHVARKAGWDTHGLPVEIEVEKRIETDFGIRTAKQQIEKIGVERFNEMCRESVWRYRSDWEELSERIGYWLDYSDPYVTYSNDYIESVWWALATMFRRGRLYRGHKVLPYCARCGTTLSSHEVAQGYKDVKDPSAYVALDLEAESGTKTRRRILVWTTTPWTLVSNVALAVNPGLEYVELRKKKADAGETVILALARAPSVLGDDFADRWEMVRSFRGTDLVGKRYKRPLDWIEYKEGKHEIIVGESFVSADEGTGVVHMAPAFGADDYAAGQRNGLAFLQPVNLRGEFPADMPLVGGMFVKDADAVILEELKRRGVLWKSTLHEHAYPHCWRCETPLLYYARTSWFIRTTEFKDAMLIRNSRVDWHPPEVGAGRFGEWLTNNIDWAVSRDRYWGTPLPIWGCDRNDSHAEAIGGYAELSERSGVALGDKFDPHKPFIDRFTWKCQCGGTMTRTPEVIDAWFDSGSMPFAQWHFPFENRDTFERYYPADFIAEGIDQTRGWFYSLLAIATGLGDALPNNLLAHETHAPVDREPAPYRAVVVNDLVLDAQGQKMSKRLGNMIDPETVIPRYGADAVRLFLTTSSQLWTPRRFDEGGIRDTAGRFLLTFKNVYTGIFAEYANFGWSPSDGDPALEKRPALDRWILSRLATVEREADELLARYEATNAAKAVITFFDEDVSKWYVRQSRHRFYDVEGENNRAAFATLHEILWVTCRLLAPFAPFITDWVHRELTGSSVHLAPYTRNAEIGSSVSGGAHLPATGPRGDVDLERAMTHIRTIATLGRAAREEAGVKVRQPLARMVCVVPLPGGVSREGATRAQAALEELSPLLAAELNIKRVEFISSADDLVTLQAKPNFRSLGRKFGKNTPLASRAVQALDSEALREFEAGKPLYVSVENESRELSAEDLTIVRRASGDLVVKEEGGYFAALDPIVTRDLRLEGLARELVSRIQRMRKELDFAVSDRITLYLGAGTEIQEAVKAFQKWIADEVLAVRVSIGDKIEGTHATHAFDLDGQSVQVALERVG
ncbi:MAG: isoleucine--tRNA ligase [Gemmatimonadota bacterium]|nr:isoleucine--tRNA ligase [Gemmatimonadota bacterium]